MFAHFMTLLLFGKCFLLFFSRAIFKEEISLNEIFLNNCIIYGLLRIMQVRIFVHFVHFFASIFFLRFREGNNSVRVSSDCKSLFWKRDQLHNLWRFRSVTLCG